MLSTGVRIWPEDLAQSSTCFEPSPPCIIHTTCSPERAAIIVRQMEDIRARKAIPDWNPALIWEVLPVGSQYDAAHIRLSLRVSPTAYRKSLLRLAGFARI